MKNLRIFIILLLLQPMLHAQTIIFDENFDAMPGYYVAGWLNTHTGTYPWQCGIPYLVGPCMAPGGAMAAHTGTDKVACFPDCGGGYHDTNVLTATPYINMAPVSGAWLQYDSYFQGYSVGSDTEKATVEISTDSGATWTILENVAPSAIQGLFDTHYINLSAYDHIGNIRIGFRYNDKGAHMNGWAINNVKVFIPAHHDIIAVSATPTDTMLSYLPIGHAYTHKVIVYNNGLDTIHAFDLCYQQDGGAIATMHITGLNMPAFTTTVFTHSIPDSVLTVDKHTVKVWATLDSDSYHANDTIVTYISGAAFMPSKRLAIESGEGTYNGWSPRNMYYLHSVPGLDVNATLISIHEADPMVDTPYHDFMFNLGWNYVPYILFDRRKSIQLDSFFYYLNVQKQYFGFADISLSSSTFGDFFSVNARVIPAITMGGDFRLALILTEDGVSGTTIDWAQANNFAFNAHGPMGGYESMANPILATDIAYNYVARAALPSPDGQPNMLPDTLRVGDTYDYTFTTVLNPAWNYHNLKAKVLLIRHNDSTILNSNEVIFPVGVANVNTPFQNATLYPNPAQETTGLYFDITKNQTIHITLTDLTGRTLYTHPVTTFAAGKNNIQLPVQQLSTGIYIVNLQSEDGQKAIKLEVVH